MNEFDDSCELMVLRALIAHRAGRIQDQRWPQTLAATVNDVLGDLTDEDDVRMKALTNNRIDRLHVGGNRRVELLC
jgi:hypothetical protein